MLLCVTGPMAAGKNAAAEILAQRHQFAVVDADELAHDAAEQAKAQIVQEFGAMAAQRGIRLLREDGSLDRRAVGALIFSDPELVRRQEAIVYPQINRMFDEFITAHSGQDIAINATVLYKVPLIERIDCVLYVDAPAIQRFFRARRRDGMPARQIRERFRSQRHLFAKYKNANADIRKVWNTGTREQLEKKIAAFLAGRRLRG